MKLLQILFLLKQLNKNDVKVSIEYFYDSLTFHIKKNSWCEFYKISFSEKECREMDVSEVVKGLKEKIKEIENLEQEENKLCVYNL